MWRHAHRTSGTFDARAARRVAPRRAVAFPAEGSSRGLPRRAAPARLWRVRRLRQRNDSPGPTARAVARAGGCSAPTGLWVDGPSLRFSPPAHARPPARVRAQRDVDEAKLTDQVKVVGLPVGSPEWLYCQDHSQVEHDAAEEWSRGLRLGGKKSEYLQKYIKKLFELLPSDGAKYEELAKSNATKAVLRGEDEATAKVRRASRRCTSRQLAPAEGLTRRRHTRRLRRLARSRAPGSRSCRRRWEQPARA